MDTTWTTRNILTDLCDGERRIEIARAFWKHAAPDTRRAAIGVLAKAMRFRDQKIKEAPIDRKTAWTAARFQDPELGTLWTEALAVYHISERRDLMAACLDAWGVPNEGGIVEAETYDFPSPEAFAGCVPALAAAWPVADLKLYFATAGLVMGHDDPRWRAAAWPAVAQLSYGQEQAEPAP